jgi:hypothetical protein
LSGWKGYASLSILAICFGDVAAAYADDRRASTLSSVGIFGLAHILALFVVVERNLVESGQLDFMTFWKDADNGFLWITGTAVALGFAFRAGDLGPRLAEWLLRRRSLGG